MDDKLIIETFMNKPIGVVLTEYRTIVTANTHFAAMFGYEVNEVLGLNMTTFYPSYIEYERTGKKWDAELRKHGKYDDVRIMKKRDGSIFWVRARGVSLSHDDPFARGVWSYSDLSKDEKLMDLTPRERDVAMQLVKGKSAKEIARVLELSPRTVEAHRARLLAKFQLNSTSQLIARLASLPIQTAN